LNNIVESNFIYLISDYLLDKGQGLYDLLNVTNAMVIYVVYAVYVITISSFF